MGGMKAGAEKSGMGGVDDGYYKIDEDYDQDDSRLQKAEDPFVIEKRENLIGSMVASSNHLTEIAKMYKDKQGADHFETKFLEMIVASEGQDGSPDSDAPFCQFTPTRFIYRNFNEQKSKPAPLVFHFIKTYKFWSTLQVSIY